MRDQFWAQLRLLAWLAVSLIGLIGLFLGAWVVLVAPIFALVPLSVGAPEISPWLLSCNAIGIGLALLIRTPNRWFNRLILGCTVLGFCLSALPLSQFPATQQRFNAAMAQTLGASYLTAIPEPVQAQFRQQPFSWIDAFRGIPDVNVRYTPNIQFAVSEGKVLALDIYRPAQSGIYPALIVIHGGAWRSGSPTDHAAFSRYMAAQGYTVWAITYRYAPQYQFPTQLNDVRAALAFVQQHAAQYETDLSRVALLGRSAGAHLALLAGYTEPLTVPLRAVVDYYSPVDLAAGYANPPQPDPINTRAVLEAFLGGTPDQFPDRYRAASPIYLASRPQPMTLLVYGGKDHIVQPHYGQDLAKRLKASGTQAVFLEIPWADHAFDAVFNGVSNQLVLYYTERFLAWALR
jgi:acetyl esterase/lipase